MSKQKLRLWAKEERKKLDIQALSNLLVSKLRTLDCYVQAKNVMLFYPLESEINLLDLLNDADKNFYLPKIEEQNLLCCPFNKDDELCESCFKTKEPLSDGVEKTILDLVIVPALVVDKNGYRLGYGKGFYDRFLKDIDCPKIVCISKKLVVDEIFSEDNDIPVDIVITD